MRREDLLIVGGGPAGSAAAILLERAGRRPLLIERSHEPADALCGGFLSWRTLAALERLGVDAFALGARRVGRLRLIAGDRIAEADLPRASAGLSRRALDAALIARVGRVERGVSAREAGPRHARLDDGGEIACDALLLATGKHELRGLARPREAAGSDPALGLRLHLPATPDLAGIIELHLFDRGYAGIVVQEDGRANLCMAVHRSRLAEAEGRPEALLATLAAESPRLGDRLAAADADAIQAVAHIPYGWRATEGTAGLLRLGDQAAVIPSLAGEGIGIALASAARGADAIAQGDDGSRFQPRLARAVRRPMAVAVGLRDAAERPGRARRLVPLLAAMPWLVGPLARLTRI